WGNRRAAVQNGPGEMDGPRFGMKRAHADKARTRAPGSAGEEVRPRARRGDPAGESWPARERHLATLDVGDPDAGVRLVTPVDRDQVRGQRLHLVGVAQAAPVHAAEAGDAPGE